MKLFGKIFLSVITMTVVIFCISGHLLISKFFNSAVETKVRTMKQLHVSVFHSLEAKTEGMAGFELKERIGMIQIPEIPETVQFRVRDEAFETIFQKSRQERIKTDKELLLKVNENADAYEICQEKEKYYITTVSMETINHNNIYVESVSDISDIFLEKEKQYQIYMQCMCVLIGVTTLLVFLLSLWISRPIRQLSKVVNKIAGGDLSKRAQRQGHDEVSVLAEDFNQMADQLEQNIIELKAAAERQEQFTSSFSHELKTPLTSIIGYSDMLRSMKMDEEERMRYGSHIFNQGKRLETLSKKMMELIVMEKTDFEMQRIDLSEMFQAIQEELQFVLEEKGILFKTMDHGVCVHAEPDLLKSILMNLVDNSRKAIEKDGRICIEAVEMEGCKRIIVTDNGKGIPKEEIERVTESFYMVDKSRKYKGGGVGLGLAICKKILDLHHAVMEIDSEVGKGTKITICFGEDV